MDVVEDNLENYILGNFDRLPRDVLKALLASLDPQALLDICITNKAFMHFCSAKKILGPLDHAALTYILANAPLSKPVRSLSEQANLIKRGFVSSYHCFIKFDPTETYYVTRNVAFGMRLDGSAMNFMIRGMPPPRGTRVWIAGSLNEHGYIDLESGDEHAVEIVDVYQTQEAGILATLGEEDFPERKNFADMLMNAKPIDDPNDNLGNAFVLEVILP